jgi:uncharacterized protein YggU (UPF0235/DUF167 family)
MKNNTEPFYIKIIVKTKQKSQTIRVVGDNCFEISLREKPEKGLANKKLLEILNNYYKQPQGGVAIINGHHSPIKLIRIGR